MGNTLMLIRLIKPNSVVEKSFKQNAYFNVYIRKSTTLFFVIGLILVTFIIVFKLLEWL